jgi:hypothetical protein
MKTRKFFKIVAFALLLSAGLNANAQVKRVQMHIGGYLCGN